MLRRLTAFLVCVLCTAVLSAQKVDRTVACSIAEYFKTYTSDRTEIKYSALDRRRNNIVVNSKGKKVLILDIDPQGNTTSGYFFLKRL